MLAYCYYCSGIVVDSLEDGCIDTCLPCPDGTLLECEVDPVTHFEQTEHD